MPQYHSGTGILIVSITAEVMSQYHSGTGILIVSINAEVMSQYHSGTGILILRGAVLTGLQDTQQKKPNTSCLTQTLCIVLTLNIISHLSLICPIRRTTPFFLDLFSLS